MPDGSVSVDGFCVDLLEEVLGDSKSCEYLCDYLQAIGAAAVVHELHYVDRHYLDDFKNYYSRSFDAPPPYCERLNFFSLSMDELDSLLDDAFRNSLKAAEATLQDAYLGFVVVRPLAGAKVGRTVLRTYPQDGRRRFEVVRPYVVNLMGLRLRVDGLAYQQQDQGAAVCASTALWSALQRVAYVAGHRTPTPSAITHASNSPFPASHGLNDTQMATALSTLGYVADEFAPAENRALFRAKIVAYLESQLPVILLMTKKVATGAGEITTGHAVTVTGFRKPDSSICVPTPVDGAEPILMRSVGVTVVYVHDDNLGSHAHYELFDSDELDEEKNYKTLKIRRGRSDGKSPSWWSIDEWTIFGALVPKPEKMRMPVEELFTNGLLWLRPTLEAVFAGVRLCFDVRFASGVEYKRSCIATDLDRESLREFLELLTLPRFVAVVSLYADEHWLCDCLLDVSEVPRDPSIPSVVGITAPGVPVRSIAALQLKQLADYFSCPLICAPPTA